MKRTTNQNSQEQEQVRATGHQQHSSGQEFATPEELLRHDADQVVVPPVIAARLAESLRDTPKPERSWWRRMFNR